MIIRTLEHLGPVTVVGRDFDGEPTDIYAHPMGASLLISGCSYQNCPDFSISVSSVGSLLGRFIFRSLGVEFRDCTISACLGTNEQGM